MLYETYIDREQLTVDPNSFYRDITVRYGHSWSLTLKPEQARELAEALKSAADKADEGRRPIPKES